MADKKSFVLYMDYAEHLEQLTDADCGILFRAIFDHMDPDKPEPTLAPGTALAMAYSFIRAQLDRDRQAYEEKCEKNRKTAIEAAERRKQSQANASERQRTQTNAGNRQHNDNDIDNDNDNDIDNDNDNDTDTNITPPAEPDGDNEKKEPLQDRRFDEFWKLYPKKVGKQAAKNSWKRIKPNAELFDRILAAVQKAKNSAQWTRNNGQYIPNPATWLNQGRWDDELEPAAASGSTAPQGSGQKFDAGRYLKEKLASFEEG